MRDVETLSQKELSEIQEKERGGSEQQRKCENIDGLE